MALQCVGPVPQNRAIAAKIKRLTVILIKPSKYDEEGYVIRYWRGVLPSNTLATLAALTEEAAQGKALGEVEIRTVMLDETVQKIEPAKIARKYLRKNSAAVVALCGVQTNQFPRAADLARELRAQGLTVMMGGFHVSGSVAMSKTGMPPECQALIDDGVTLVKGEVEECWADLLRDALFGRLKPFYEISPPPDLSRANIPVVDPKLMKRYAYPYMGTIDAGRGCPFNCSFCTIINVQGHTMRNRLAERIKDRIRRNAALKIDYYFFTDDNFSRNPQWEAIFDALTDLREQEDIRIRFMMQIDTQAYRIKNFMSKAALAGCSQVFIGMETINPANIPAAGKLQNRVQDYAKMIEAWHANGIACHVGYIIGFPFDTVQSVREDIVNLRDQIKVDQASFFILTPLPGSQDHTQLTERGEWMDPDYNNFDSFRPVTKHPRMSRHEWFEVYQEAWREFYNPQAMKAILGRAHDGTYWGLFKNYVWYKYSAVIELTHPMICGFIRFKDRVQKRPGWPVEGRWAHLRRRTREAARWAQACGRFYFEMQEVWLATRGRAQLQRNIRGLRERYEELRGRAGQSATQFQQNLDNLRGHYGELKLRAGHSAGRASHAMSQQLAHLRGRAAQAWSNTDQLSAQMRALGLRDHPRQLRARRWLRRLNPLAIHTHTRADLNRYWSQTWTKLRHGQLWRINPLGVAFNFCRDLKLCAMFNLNFVITGFWK